MICTTTPRLPRSESGLSPPTSTEGTVRSTSTALPPEEAGRSLTVYAVRSGATATSLRCPVTCTAESSVATVASARRPRSTALAASVTRTSPRTIGA